MCENFFTYIISFVFITLRLYRYNYALSRDLEKQNAFPKAIQLEYGGVTIEM